MIPTTQAPRVSNRVFIVAAIAAMFAILTSASLAEARSNSGGSKAGGIKSSGPSIGAMRSNSGGIKSAAGTKNSGKLHCVGSGCPKFGERAPTIGKNKEEKPRTGFFPQQ